METTNKYPIKVVARITGLSVHVIRMWEKRYQLVSPLRTDSNRRLYSENDIQRLQLLKRLTDDGYAIGQIAALSTSDLQKMVNQEPGVSTSTSRQVESAAVTAGHPQHIQRLVAAVRKLDARELEHSLLRVSVAYSQPMLLEKLIIPFMAEIGRLWQEGSLRIFHEHLATTVIHKFLSDRLMSIPQSPNSPALIVATPAGQIHEIGALIVAVLAVTYGWQVTYLGANLPVEEIAAAALEKEATVILLSITYPAGDPELHQELLRLPQMISPVIRVMIGGRAASSYQNTISRMNAIYFPDLKEFRDQLAALQP